MHPAHRTPLKRISRGSLFALSRSQKNTDAPHGLGFLESALPEFVDEVEQLSVNAEGITRLAENVATFNESFASWLHVMNMNALTLDWTQAPTEGSFYLATQRAEKDTLAAQKAAQAAVEQAAAAASALLKQELVADVTEAELTYVANTIAATMANASSGSSSKPKLGKKGIKVKISAKEKKERAMAIDRVIACLPLEFRGNEPTLRRNMEMVIEGLMFGDGGGVRLLELISPPDLNQARVNKCLIALVNRKVVQKDSSSGTVLYYWQGVPG